jgi:hypothetical protein
MTRIAKRFYATLSAAKYRRTVRILQRAHVALGEVAENAAYFDRAVMFRARAALALVPDSLRVQVCAACGPTGYNDGDGDGYVAYSCLHPNVPCYDMNSEV